METNARTLKRFRTLQFLLLICLAQRGHNRERARRHGMTGLGIVLEMPSPPHPFSHPRGTGLAFPPSHQKPADLHHLQPSVAQTPYHGNGKLLDLGGRKGEGKLWGGVKFCGNDFWIALELMFFG